jgi:type IV pilus assembly protein PilE
MINKTSGFTLIELVIVIAIVGILTTIALPSYQESVRKSRRRDAQAELLNFANAMERYFTEAGSYCDAGGAGGSNTCGVAGTNDTGTASIFSPSTSVSTYYTFTISAMNNSGTSYTLQAAPVAGGPQASDSCGTLTITQTGVKSPSTVGCW